MKKSASVILFSILSIFSVNASDFYASGNIVAGGYVVGTTFMSTTGPFTANGNTYLGYYPTTNTYALVVGANDQTVVLTKAQGDISMGQFGY